MARLHASATTRVLLVQGDRLAVVGDAEGHGWRLAFTAPAALPAPQDPAPTPPPRVDAADDPADVVRDAPAQEPPPLWLYLGEHDGVSYAALVLGPDDDAAALAADLRPVSPEVTEATPGWEALRTLVALDPLEQGLATQAVALANWHAVYAFCPRCGAPTQVRKAGWVRWCPGEDRELYPRTDPAVIMAVVDDDDRLLLGHAAHWSPGRYSTLAGFVEPGEALEQAVRREVAEEVGVTVAGAGADVVYRGSQAWPFPASLMLGFRARVSGRGEAPVPDGAELTDARWFTRDELLAAATSGDVILPARLSIARALIEEWYGGPLPGRW